MTIVDRTGALDPRRDATLVGLVALVAAVLAIAAALAGTAGLAIVIAAIAGVAATIALPGAMLALYFLIPLYKGALQPFSPVDLTVLLAVANAAQAVPLLLDRHRRRDVSVTGLALWGALALLVLAGVLWAPDRQVALARTVTVWLLLFVPVVPAALRVGGDERYLRQVVATFLVAGVVTVVLGLATLSRSDRLVVFDTNTIETARAALLVPLLAIIFVPEQPSLLIRSLALAGGILAVLVGLASGSRGPVIALLAIAAVGLLWRVATSRGPGARTLVGAALLLGVVVAILASGSIDLPAASTERFTSFGEFLASLTGQGAGGGIDADSAGARLSLFGFAVDLFASSPLIGVGTAGYPSLSPAALGTFDANAYPHNAVLQVAAEYGLVGLAILAGIVVLALIRPLPDRSYGRVVRLLFVFYLLNAMVSGDVFDDRMTWGLAVLLLLIDVAPAVRRIPGGRDDGSMRRCDDRSAACDAGPGLLPG